MEPLRYLAPLALLLVSACQAATPTEQPQIEKIGAKSPVVVCSTADTAHPTAISMVIFQEVGQQYEVDVQRLSGSGQTKPAPDGGLDPFEDMVRTGLMGINVPYAIQTDSSGNETVLTLDLAQCLVSQSARDDLHKFFENSGDKKFKLPGEQIRLEQNKKIADRIPMQRQIPRVGRYDLHGMRATAAARHI